MIRPAEEKNAAVLSQLRYALWPESSASTAAHQALGFAEAGLTRCFCKKL
jgi:hypothetical protein